MDIILRPSLQTYVTLGYHQYQGCYCNFFSLNSFVISAPKVFWVGASENVVIQAHGYTEAFDATISIRSYPDRKVTYSSGCVNLSPENKFQNSTLLTIQDKQLSAVQSSFSYVYLEVVSKHFSKSEKRPILYDNGSLFVHTDKPVYTPQQHVKVGVLSLGDALEPVTQETVLTFIDPEGSEVDKVQGNNLTGAVSFPDFHVPSNPKYGRWTIQAKYREDASTNGTTHFDVKEHDEAQGVSLQSTDYLEQKIREQAATYKHPVVKKCCYDGARRSEHETCEQRADRVKIGPNCVQAFTQCCTMATQIRANDTFKEFILGHDGIQWSPKVQPFNHSSQEVETSGSPRVPGQHGHRVNLRTISKSTEKSCIKKEVNEEIE